MILALSSKHRVQPRPAASVAVDSLLQYAWKLILPASRGNWDNLRLNLKSHKRHTLLINVLLSQ